MDELTLYRAILIGAGIATSMLILAGVYVKLRTPIQRWIATFRMKSLFWKDRRRRARKPRR